MAWIHLKFNIEKKLMEQKGNVKVIVTIIIGIMIILLGVSIYFVLTRQPSNLVNQAYSVDDKKTNESASFKSGILSANEASGLISCGSIRMPLPQEWQNLKNIETTESGKTKLDSNGCSSDNAGCLCIRKKPQSEKNIIIAVLTTPNLGKDLVDCTNKSSKKTFLEMSASVLKEDKKSDEQIKEEYPIIFGNEGIKLTFTSLEQKHGTLFFIKDCKLYSFDLVSEKQEYDILWPQIEKSISSIEF